MQTNSHQYLYVLLYLLQKSLYTFEVYNKMQIQPLNHKKNPGSFCNFLRLLEYTYHCLVRY